MTMVGKTSDFWWIFWIFDMTSYLQYSPMLFPQIQRPYIAESRVKIVQRILLEVIFALKTRSRPYMEFVEKNFLEAFFSFDFLFSSGSCSVFFQNTMCIDWLCRESFFCTLGKKEFTWITGIFTFFSVEGAILFDAFSSSSSPTFYHIQKFILNKSYSQF